MLDKNLKAAEKENHSEAITLGELITKYKVAKADIWKPSTRNDYETITKVLNRFVDPEVQVVPYLDATC